ncbi:heme NO binding associated [Haematococcus lacustris]|uniref:Heme NO binding associated n=1 Tax=Haematococcus lacustris TaxID=44745 RepID=A0A699ZVT9_HAELA|nr:heme NO binding associated [Haematococcus lacustris]
MSGVCCCCCQLHNSSICNSWVDLALARQGPLGWGRLGNSSQATAASRWQGRACAITAQHPCIGQCSCSAGVDEPGLRKTPAWCADLFHCRTPCIDDTAVDGAAYAAYAVGLASGPVFASVISHKMAHVTLIGDTTNVAARMESSSKPMHIHSQASIPPGLTSTASYDIPAASSRSFLEAAPHSQRVNSSKSNVQVCVNIDTDIAEGAKQHVAVPNSTSEQADEMLVGSRVEVADPDTGCTLFLEARGAQNIKGKG